MEFKKDNKTYYVTVQELFNMGLPISNRLPGFKHDINKVQNILNKNIEAYNASYSHNFFTFGKYR